MKKNLLENVVQEQLKSNIPMDQKKIFFSFFWKVFELVQKTCLKIKNFNMCLYSLLQTFQTTFYFELHTCADR